MKKIMRVANSLGAIEFLLKGQLKYLQNYFDVVAVAPNGENIQEVEQQQNTRIISLNMKRRFDIWGDLVCLIKFVKIIRKEKPDLIHSITPKAGLLSMIAGFLCGIPHRAHTFTGLVFPTSKGVKKEILKFTDKITCLCATHVFAEGAGVKNDLINYNITNKEINIIGNGNINGVDLDYYYPQYEPHDNFIFIFCGRIVKDKGMNELATAFKKLTVNYPDIELYLVGKFEDDLDPIEPTSKDFFLNSKNVKLYPWQNDIRPFFHKADILVFPSYREGFPNIVLQAGAMGIPCIATDINGCNDIIKDRYNGYLIASQDADALYKKMEYAINHKSEIKSMQENCRKEIVQKYEQYFVWNEIIKEYNTLLKK